MKSKKIMAVILTASILMSVSSCEDKSIDEVLDLAEDVSSYTCDLDYKKLSKLTEDGDDKLEKIFDSIEDNYFWKAIASTLEFEFEEDSLEKDGKNGYTVEVTFTYVDYEKACDGEYCFWGYDEFDELLEDCDDVVEETITLEFEKNGSDILFVNIDDLEDLFPYCDEEFLLIVDYVSDTAEEDADSATETAAASDDTSDTAVDYSSGWEGTDYPDPADYLVAGECYLLPNTNILFTVPSDSDFDETWAQDGINSDASLYLSGYWGTTYEDYYSIVYTINESCFSQSAYESRDNSIERQSTNVAGYESHEVTEYDLTIGDVTYEGMLSTVTRSNGELYYVYVVPIGNDSIRYYVSINTTNLENVYNFQGCFSVI